MNKDMKMLRIYASNTDKIGNVNLYQFVAAEAKKRGLAGATVYKGVLGYGSSSRLVMDTFWEFSEKIPVVIEMIDTAEEIDSFVSHIRPLIEKSAKGCLMATCGVDVVLSKQGGH